jgi:ABC-2 type transport system permease protein
LRESTGHILATASLFILAGLSIGLYISTIRATPAEAFLSMCMFLLPAIILSGFLYPVHTMPTAFRYLTSMNPLRHFIDVVRGIFPKGADLGDLCVLAGVLLVMSVIGLALATRRFPRTLEG